ncbi:MAG: DNA gyrase inhibitor YacG [Gammaproteobacteria bacterium]
MTARSPIEVKCPTCCATVVWSDASSWKPFCSERCRLLDLGAWFTEERAIPDTADQEDAGMTQTISPASQTDD